MSKLKHYQKYHHSVAFEDIRFSTDTILLLFWSIKCQKIAKNHNFLKPKMTS